MNATTALRLAAAASVFSAVAAGARPTFVERSLEPSGLAVVESVNEGLYEDLVLLSGGLADGFRSGMVANVEREGERIARLLVVDASPDRAVALILDLAPNRTIQPEDRVLRSLIRIC